MKRSIVVAVMLLAGCGPGAFQCKEALTITECYEMGYEYSNGTWAFAESADGRVFQLKDAFLFCSPSREATGSLRRYDNQDYLCRGGDCAIIVEEKSGHLPSAECSQ